MLRVKFFIKQELQISKMDNAYFNYTNDSSCAFVSIMFTSAKLAYFLISKEFLNDVTPSVLDVSSFYYEVFLTWKRSSNYCWGLMLTVSESTNISFLYDTRSESRKWMSSCRFQIKDILLFNFYLVVLWHFRKFDCVSRKYDFLNQLRLAKELDVTVTLVL